MASPTLNPHKKLGEFLHEEQEPFILEVYLSEREYSNRWSSNDGDSTNTSEKPTTSGLNKRKKGILPFFHMLKALYKKLSFPKESKSVLLTKVYEHDQRNKHEAVLEHTQLDHILQFSSDSRFTMFSSCQDIDEEGTSMLSHKQQHLFYSHTLYNMVPQQRRQRQRFIEGGHELLRRIHVPRAPNVIEDIRRMQQRNGILVPKKMRGESLLSAAGRWGGLLEETKKKEEVVLPGTNDVSQMLKSKRVLHRIKKMLFDCVKDIAISLPTEDDRKRGYRQFMGPLQIGKLIRQRTNKWDQQGVAVGGANLTYLLTLDYLNSLVEWKKFEPHVRDISIEITDAILDNILNEIVIEIIGTSTPNT